MRWIETSKERLLAARHRCGAWGYAAGSAPAAEPTALACIALASMEQYRSVTRRAIDWLTTVQRVDGSVPAFEKAANSVWPSSLSILAWQSAAESDGAYQQQIERAAGYLSKIKGGTYPNAPAIFGHDLTLAGWPWVRDTHSWLEPTAYAVRALTECGQCDHTRVREGVQLILNRALPNGGWNYGNTRVLSHMLRPFPATTGLALYALEGEPMDEPIRRSIEYLQNALLSVHAPWSLSWGLIGLAAWNAAPSESQSLLANCAARLTGDHDLVLPVNVMDDALMLWANRVVSATLKPALMGQP